MSILQATAPAAKPPIFIKGHAYSVQPIPPGEFGVSAVRLTKLADRATCDVIRTRENLIECSCPTGGPPRGPGTFCKHGVAAMDKGLLPAAVLGSGSPAVEAPTPVPASAAPDQPRG